MTDLLTRRNILIGAGGAVVVAGSAYEAIRLVRGHHPASPYDDLLARLEDRDSAAELGKAMLAEVGTFDAKAASAALRAKFARATLAPTALADATAGDLLEASGWVVPEAVGLLCELAAKAA